MCYRKISFAVAHFLCFSINKIYYKVLFLPYKLIFIAKKAICMYN